MGLFGHHTTGYMELELFGYDLTPEGPTEHVIAAVVSGLAVLLFCYGGYALVRDLLRWRRRGAEASNG